MALFCRHRWRTLKIQWWKAEGLFSEEYTYTTYAYQWCTTCGKKRLKSIAGRWKTEELNSELY